MTPMAQQGQHRPAGFLVAGINPYRRLDDAYTGFVNLVAGQIAAGLANAQAYEEERQRAEALAQIDRAKTTFFSNVSHEFRTPLTLMLSPLEEALAFSDEQVGPDTRSLVSVAHRNGIRLLKLVNTLLDFSRIEAGRVTASYEATDLAEFTVELASNFRSALDKAGLRLVIDAEPLPQPVYIDRDMWERIVLNLLSNAFKFTFERTITVAVKAASDANHAEVSVGDTGTGIPPGNCRICSSGSAAWKARVGAPSRAAGSASRWCRNWSSCTAATSMCTARLAAAVPSPSAFHSERPIFPASGWAPQVRRSPPICGPKPMSMRRWDGLTALRKVICRWPRPRRIWDGRQPTLQPAGSWVFLPTTTLICGTMCAACCPDATKWTHSGTGEPRLKRPGGDDPI
jgi:hypothetical protein